MMNNPTLRTISGAAPAQCIDASHAALLLVDFQNEYFEGNLPLPQGAQALRNAQRLMAHADHHRIPVVHVQHVAPAGSPVFAENTVGVELHRDLQPAPHHAVIRKTSVSAFATTDLDQRLKATGRRTLVVAGLMTHACVAGTARDAVPLGYDVIVVNDACATRDLDALDGLVPHAVLHRAALASIEDTFGEVMTTQRLVGLPVR